MQGKIDNKMIYNENVNSVENENVLFIWLTIIPNMSYILYLRLLNVFDDIYSIYNESKNKTKFLEILNNNNFNLSNELINSLTSFFLKEKSYKIYLNLKNQKVSIININSKHYPNNLLKMYNPPFCLFLFGNKNIVNNKIVYLHYEEFNNYGNKIYNIISCYLKEKGICCINEYKQYVNNIEEYICNNKYNSKLEESLYNKIFLHTEDILNFKFSIEDKFSKLEDPYKEAITSKSLHIILPYYNLKNEYYIYDIIGAISNICIIPQAKYSKGNRIKNIVDTFVDQNKNILVCPGNIYCENNYFSNYLIKEGAEVLLNKHELDKYFK